MPRYREDWQAVSACNCIDLTNAALSEHNTELGTVHIMHEQGWSRRIAITTNVVEKRRGAKPVRIVAQYCPLCGEKYDQPAQTEGVS